MLDSLRTFHFAVKVQEKAPPFDSSLPCGCGAGGLGHSSLGRFQKFQIIRHYIYCRGRPQVALLFCTIFMKLYGLVEQSPVVFVGKGLAPSAFLFNRQDQGPAPQP